MALFIVVTGLSTVEYTCRKIPSGTIPLCPFAQLPDVTIPRDPLQSYLPEDTEECIPLFLHHTCRSPYLYPKSVKQYSAKLRSNIWFAA
jgi:hypothetical protein